MSVEDAIGRWSSVPEGQFFERKSALDRSGGRVRRRKTAEIAKDIAETLSAMANADGGELVVGIEDEGTVTGVPHPAHRVALLLRVAGDRNYVSPPLPCRAGEARTSDGKALLHFEVEWSPEVHRLADGRYVLRVYDANVPRAAEEIAALKQTKTQGLFERGFPPGATADDLDLALVEVTLARAKVDLPALEYLRQRRLVDGRNGRTVPCLAGLLLFGKDPGRWHPRCGIDFVRWKGTERTYGSALNIAKRIPVAGPLATLVERAQETIRPFIGERQQLVDLFFAETLEYPTVVWQEAIVNAVAHRDYSLRGASIEVWMFDDRMEIRSPGLPPRPVTVEALNRRENIHLSRNPLIVRVLSDLGYMRELGEGIPRMFAEMERQGFYPPVFRDVGGVSFEVAIRNEPIYDRATLEWLRRFGDMELTGDQKRLLAFAHAQEDRFTSRDYQKLACLDIYGASSSIKDLIRKGAARSTGKGSRIYQVVEPGAEGQPVPHELRALVPMLREKVTIQNPDVCRELGVSPRTARRILAELVAGGWLTRSGQKRWTRYSLADDV